jgi:hypothetical protein
MRELLFTALLNALCVGIQLPSSNKTIPRIEEESIHSAIGHPLSAVQAVLLCAAIGTLAKMRSPCFFSEKRYAIINTKQKQ